MSLFDIIVTVFSWGVGLWCLLLCVVSTTAAMQCCNEGDNGGTTSRGILALVFLFAARWALGV